MRARAGKTSTAKSVPANACHLGCTPPPGPDLADRETQRQRGRRPARRLSPTGPLLLVAVAER